MRLTKFWRAAHSWLALVWHTLRDPEPANPIPPQWRL